VMPCSPTSWSASFTSSSLKGLMMASIFFIAFFLPPNPPLCCGVPHYRLAEPVPSRTECNSRYFTML
jgi:hypothetical protein